MKISKYTKLGLLIISSVAILIWGLNYLKGIDYFNTNTTYYAVYDRVDGLMKSSAVDINGYQVGQVKDISFSDKNDGSLIVTFSIEGKFKLPIGTEARIISSDIMGTRSIKLLINPNNQFYAAYDTIPASIEGDLKEQVSMQVLPLKNKAEQLLASLDSAITVITYVFNPEARKNLSESFAHINQTIINLESASAELDLLLRNERGNIQGVMENMNQLTSTLASSSEDFSAIADNLANITDSISAVNLKEMMESLSESTVGINDIIAKVNSKEGSAGLLINDPELYQNLTQLSLSMDYLLKDFRNNPKRYVHFSALDLGKSIYINPEQNSSASNSDYTFKVHLLSSPERLNLNNPIFEGFTKVEETEIAGIYNYSIGNSSDIQEMYPLLEKAKKVFPDASIIAFKNGRQVKLDKALRKIGQ
ncbi:MlaD family protein [Mangrovibacterium diazotrophicum]|uniref:Phospholipid/cholesterol/gamma-HCH transport system substrate-binding protein n=1 Tax=Mangrovibacterium diazotrophicum TaxID=1261403 RepID=A0A419W3R6_9BACT|nr:MlaD family protein [Mangrovibacterium diazotrophicum]RKD90131.1 phospholipid/cholesterol/gamma-HCH transport system substrate-binding protein [Mangrovibacterium diazotrophicum]